jgi:hypothetical protein
MAANAPLAAAGRILLGLCFHSVTHFADLMNVCFPLFPAWLLPVCYAAFFLLTIP